MMIDDAQPLPAAIRSQLERILQSSHFKGSPKQRAFLSFVVNETLADRVSQLKGYTVAVAVYGRNEKFNPQVDPIVRVKDIAHNIVGAIADQYGFITRRLSKESRKKAPAKLEAYDAILRFYHYETVLTPQAIKTALAALEKAVEIEPEYALAWAMLGHLHADNFALGFCEIGAPLEKALNFAQKAVALAPQNQFAHDALALVYFHRGDKKLFLQHLDQTLALNPNSPYIVGVAGWHMVLYGEYERGLGLLKKGIPLNPYHPTWFHLALFMDSYSAMVTKNTCWP